MNTWSLSTLGPEKFTFNLLSLAFGKGRSLRGGGGEGVEGEGGKEIKPLRSFDAKRYFEIRKSWYHMKKSGPNLWELRLATRPSNHFFNDLPPPSLGRVKLKNVNLFICLKVLAVPKKIADYHPLPKTLLWNIGMWHFNANSQKIVRFNYQNHQFFSLKNQS